MNNEAQFKELNAHLLHDETPSVYFNSPYFDALCKKYPFDMLGKLKKTRQSKQYHPEGSAWNHTMLVLDEAARQKGRSGNPQAFMWAALLHDIGKADTTAMRNGKVTSYNHEKLGATLTRKFLAELDADPELIKEVEALVRWHMQILFVLKDLPFAQVKDMKQQTRPEEVSLLGLCDRMGRQGADRAQEEKNIELFMQKTLLPSNNPRYEKGPIKGGKP